MDKRFSEALAAELKESLSALLKSLDDLTLGKHCPLCGRQISETPRRTPPRYNIYDPADVVKRGSWIARPSSDSGDDS